MAVRCKKSIVRWIMNNPGYVYSHFTFLPESEGEVLPTAEEFEALTCDIDKWTEVEDAELSNGEQAMYPNAVHRYKYIFQPLDGELYAHVFTDTIGDVQYVVLLT